MNSTPGDLTPVELDLINREEEILLEVVASLKSQQEHVQRRFTTEHARAMELTADLVAFTRLEDKQ